ncbi:unnamed protein product [Trifolium pratense]|uniref:Uncharacterized protein n=1 Tax=Trifolium pratense TaxID=57577 RepID=A0ACB0JJH1_TRIPR|nr:unnamed protein product [Trifolium pratense]
MDNQQVESSLSCDIRIKSRKANASDCINFLRPGIDISLLLGYRNDSDQFNPIPSSWVDAKIHSIERKPHKSGQCLCDFYLNFFDHQEAIAFDIDQIYILQRLQHNTCEGLLEKNNSFEVKPTYRWGSSEDCFTLSESRLMLEKFYSDLSWFVTTSRLKKTSFIIRSDQNKIVAENQTLGGGELDFDCTEIVSGPQHDDDAASCFSDIIRLLDSAPSVKSGALSSNMVEIVAPDSEGVMTLFRELKEIFSMSNGVDSFDQATITKAQSLVEELRPLLLQLPKSSREAFHVFDMFITSLAANKPLLAAVASHDQAIVFMNEIRQEALALKAEAEAIHQERAQKRQKISTRATKIDRLKRKLATLEQEQLNDKAEEKQMTDKLTQGVQHSNPVMARAIDVKNTLSFLPDANYNKGVLIRQELEALLTDAVPLAST